MHGACALCFGRFCFCIVTKCTEMQPTSKAAVAPQHVIRLGGQLSRNRKVHTCKRKIELCASAIDSADLQNYAGKSLPASAQRVSPAKEQQLIDWIRQHDGFVHPSLLVVDKAPCGCRGMVASRDIEIPQVDQQKATPQATAHDPALQAFSEGSSSDTAALPLSAACGRHLLPVIAVPEELYMTTEDAVEVLGSAIWQHRQAPGIRHNSSDASSLVKQLFALPQQLLRQKQQQQLAESLTKLQPPLLLALFLAHERSKAQHSKWHLYIDSLPEEPPCGWFSTLQRRLTPRHQQNISHEAVAAAAAAVEAKCSGAADLFGDALGITADDITWAFGQVVSRAFGSGGVVGLAPLIDMLNHQQGSCTPQLLTVPAAAAEQEKATIKTVRSQASAKFPAAPSAAGVDDGQGDIAGMLSQADSNKNTRRFWAVCLAPKQQQQHLVLSAGDEVYISYIATCDATTAYLNFGFVPPEKM